MCFFLWCCNPGGCELLCFRFRVYLHWLLYIFGRAKKNAKSGGKSEFWYRYLSVQNSTTNILQTTPLWRSFKQHLSEGPSENTSSNISWLSCSYFAFLPTIWMMDKLTIKGKFIQVKVLSSTVQNLWWNTPNLYVETVGLRCSQLSTQSAFWKMENFENLP